MKAIFWVLVIVSIGVVIVISICKPELLVNNQFLKNFINHELLNILAVIVTVTAASTANIHLAFNRVEEKIKKNDYFKYARQEVNHGAIFLILLFLILVVLLIVRSYFLHNMNVVSFINGISLIILLVNILVLLDVTLTVFAIHPIASDSDGT